MNYADIREGDYFAVEKTAFQQTDDDRDWNFYEHATRPRPTRLWDGSFLALPDNTKCTLVSREEAIRLAISSRVMFGSHV